MKKQPVTTKQASTEQVSGKRATQRPVPSGQERMVTQAERDEVEALLQQQAEAQSAAAERSEVEHEVV
jgi:hypothetical protein